MTTWSNIIIFHLPGKYSAQTQPDMPFYQMLCITVHYNEYVRFLFSHHLQMGNPHTYSSRSEQKHIKELVRQTAMHVLNAGGAVRGINSWGTSRLPQRMRRHQQNYNIGE